MHIQQRQEARRLNFGIQALARLAIVALDPVGPAGTHQRMVAEPSMTPSHTAGHGRSSSTRGEAQAPKDHDPEKLCCEMQMNPKP